MTPLLYGPYSAPTVRRGDWLMCEVAGLTEVGGYTSAAIPWPRRKKTGKASLILTGDLVSAVRRESVEAICHHWGVGVVTVWAWRKALGVERITEGTRHLLQERTGVPPEAAARGRDQAASPAARAKMAATKTGQPVSPATRAALLKTACRPKPEGWGKHANAWMQAAKQKKA